MKKMLLTIVCLPMLAGCVLTDLALPGGSGGESLDGFERLVIYRYKDAVADPADFSREIQYRKIETGPVVFDAPTDAVTTTTPPAAADVIGAMADEILSEFGDAIAAGEAAAAEIKKKKAKK